MRLSAGVVILSDGTLLRDVTITVVDGVINDISLGVDVDATYYAVVTPMFHNGHSHAEYQLLSGILPSGSFFPWVRELVRLKFCLPNRLWAISTLYGVKKLLEMGYASTEDCSDSGFAAATMSACGLRGTSYREVNGLVSDVDAYRCESRIDALHNLGRHYSVGVAPHAVYSTCQAVLDVVLKRAEGLPLCIHVDESPEEDLFCRNNSGPFIEMYKRRGIEHKSPRTEAGVDRKSEDKSVGLFHSSSSTSSASGVHTCVSRDESHAAPADPVRAIGCAIVDRKSPWVASRKPLKSMLRSTVSRCTAPFVVSCCAHRAWRLVVYASSYVLLRSAQQ